MCTRELIEKELAELPEPMQQEVYDFVRFLRLKRDDDRFNGLLASESSLAKDWNAPEGRGVVKPVATAVFGG